jgi:hypothetical protein
VIRARQYLRSLHVEPEFVDVAWSEISEGLTGTALLLVREIPVGDDKPSGEESAEAWG